MTSRIRRAMVKDVPIVGELIRAAMRFHGLPDTHFTDDVARRDLFGADGYLRALIADLDAAPVGVAMWHPSYEPAYASRGAYLAELFVAEAARRRGVGHALMAAVARQARDQGFAHVWWLSADDNHDARAFYASLAQPAATMHAQAVTRGDFQRLADSAPELR